MKQLVALVLAFGCAAAGAADSGAKQRIELQYKAEKAHCSKLDSRKERKACEKSAQGHRDVALADLKADPKHGDWLKADRARQNAIGGSSDAQYSVEKDRCKQLSGDAKDHCIADAKKKFSKG